MMVKVANNAFTMGLCILGLCIWFSPQEINVLRCRLVTVDNCPICWEFQLPLQVSLSGN